MNGITTTETNASSDVQVQDRDEVDHEQQDDASHADGLFAEEAAQRIHIGGDALDQVTCRGGGVVGETQALDVVEEEIAQTARNAFGGVRSQTSGKERKVLQRRRAR